VGSLPQLQVPPWSSKCALIVDADPHVMSAVCGILNSQEWAIVRAFDNHEALKLVQELPFDLIITGSKTNAKEDIELLREIRRTRPHVRLIILTDESTPADVIAAMRERAFSYFSKSFSIESLTEIVRIATVDPPWDDGIEIASATPEWISIIARCDRPTAERLVQFFHEVSDLPNTERDDVAAAFREMLLNAIEHGGKFDPNQYVEVAYVRTSKAVMCRIKDPGQGFLLEEIHHSAVNNPVYDPLRHVLFREAHGLRPGGYGVLLAKHLVDELMYSEKGNEVLLIKYLSTPPD
jgi:anti-sigma regulatory factor (Ser/Thr protein kinase)/ActR/RegA family two-component response regulator